MDAITWEQHLAWCKERALAYLPGDPVNAGASMVSDLGKHEDRPAPVLVVALLKALGPSPTVGEVRAWIEGWN